jgi:WD40 repeat protein
LNGHASPISGVAAFSDRYIATAGYDNRVILWSPTTTRPLARGFHDHLANQCAFSSDGTLLVSASSDYTARLWSVPDLRLKAVLTGHDDDVEAAIFSPDQSKVATASRDGAVRVFALDGRLIQCFRGHHADVLSVDWLADSVTLISSGDDGTIRRWSLGSNQAVNTIDLGGVETDTVVVGRAGEVFVGTDEGQILCFGPLRVQTVNGHRAGVKRLALSQAKNRLASVSYDGTVKVWNLDSALQEPLGEFRLPADVWGRACCFGPRGQLVFGSFGARYRTYDVCADVWDDPPPPTGGFNAICSYQGSIFTIGDAGILHKDGAPVRQLGTLCNFLEPWDRRLLTGGHAGTLYDALSGETLYRHHAPLNCAVTYHVGDRSRAMIGTYTGEGIVLEMQDSSQHVDPVRVIKLHANAVKGVCESEGLIFSISADTSCTWVSAAENVVRRKLEHGHTRIANGCCSLPGGRFVSVSRDRKLRIWDQRGCEVSETPHTHSVKCIAVAEGGRFAATGSYGGHVGIIDLTTKAWLSCERVSMAGISNLAYDLGNRLFLASSYDGMIHRLSAPV